MLYLIQAYGEDYSLLKIGFSDNLENRLSQYLDCNPLTKILKTREGGKDLESYLHLHFSKYKYPEKREWFYYSSEIVDEFDKIELPSKDEMTIEFILTNPLFDDRLGLFHRFLKKNPDKLNLIPEEYKKYLELINTSFRKDVLDKKINRIEEEKSALVDNDLFEKVSNYFKVGNVYTRKEIKEVVNSFLSDLGYKKIIFKANDIDFFFETRQSRTIDSVSNKPCMGFKILSLKDR